MATSRATTNDAVFNSAHGAVLSAIAMRQTAQHHLGTAEEVEPLVDALFQRMIDTPAVGLVEVIAKADIIMAEYGEGNAIPSYMVEALVADLRRLEQ